MGISRRAYAGAKSCRDKRLLTSENRCKTWKVYTTALRLRQYNKIFIYKKKTRGDPRSGVSWSLCSYTQTRSMDPYPTSAYHAISRCMVGQLTIASVELRPSGTHRLARSGETLQDSPKTTALRPSEDNNYFTATILSFRVLE